MSITATEARARLFPLIEEVNADQKAVEIVSKRGTAYLVPADEYEALQETVYLLRSPANVSRLRDSIAEAEAGATKQHDLIDP
jgi:antitoxin YefM